MKDSLILLENVIVVGSGAGGATVAKELAQRGKSVTILEAGAYPKMGTEMRATGFYTGSLWGPGEFSKEGVEILRTEMVGGSSCVTIGNGVRALQKEFRTHGIDLEDEFQEAEAELNILPCPEENLGPRTRLLMKASEEVGYDMRPMPKFIDFNRCEGCGGCVIGCVKGAKWTSRNYIGVAFKEGAKLEVNHRVQEVLHNGGEVKGVKVQTPEGVKELESDLVVLAAGGIGTPVILQNSGLEAGTHLFADTLITTFGSVKGANFKPELGMASIVDEFHDSEGYILSPNMEGPLDLLTDRVPLSKKLAFMNTGKLIGVMAKTRDEPNGTVHPDGAINKPVPPVDAEKIEKGYERSKVLLEAAGADPKTIFRTHIRGAHPGGTAGMGRVINNEQETEVSGLFVSDCSAFPESPGKPPVLTIVALSKHLAGRLAEEHL
jgi:choline dehydrogenase-like flavoprotein